LSAPLGRTEHPVVCRRNGADGRNGILRVDCPGELLRCDREPRQLRIRYLDEDVLVRVAKVVDLGDTGHAQQDRAQLVRVVVQLRRRKAVAFERIDVRVDITELVVEKRSNRPLGQGRGDVAHFLAHLVPGLGDLLDRGRVLHGEEDHRLAGPRVTLDVVDVRRRLQLTADPVRDLFLHLAGSRARPVSFDHHGPERERRVFRLGKLRISDHAEQGCKPDQKDHQLLMAQRPRGEIEAAFAMCLGVGRGHGRAVTHGFTVACVHDEKSSECNGATTCTCWSALTACTPCITTRSPLCRPPVTETVRSS